MARKIRSKEIMSAEQLAEIGSIALESTECEVIIEKVLWALAGLDHERGIHFTQNMQMKSRLELLTTLGRSRLSDVASLSEFNALVEELKVLNTKRNHVIHGIWGAWIPLREMIKQSGPNLSITPKAMKLRPNRPPVELSADQLKGLPEQIAQATKRLMQFAETTWPAIF